MLRDLGDSTHLLAQSTGTTEAPFLRDGHRITQILEGQNRYRFSHNLFSGSDICLRFVTGLL